MRERRGFTLMEVLTVIATTSVVMSAGVWTLHKLMRTELGGRQRLVNAVAFSRLSQQFRSDVHAADHASVGNQMDDAAERISLRLAEGRTVTYRQVEEVVLREESQAGQSLRQEEYRLQPGASIKFDVQNRQGKDWVLMSLRSTAAADRAADQQQAIVGDHPLRVEAWLNKDHRFAEVSP